MFAGLLIFCCAFLCACGPQKLSVGVIGLPETLDPQIETSLSAQEIFQCVFRCLLRREGSELVCDAAEDYECSEDGCTLTFRLRGGMTWSDGAPVTADDYAFAVERVLAPQTASPYAPMLMRIQGAQAFSAGTASGLTGVSCPDPQTLILRLTQPDDGLPQQFAATCLAPCRRDFFEETAGSYGMSVSHTRFNGDYRVSGKSGGAVTLERRSAANLPKEVRFQDVTDEEAAALQEALDGGELTAVFSARELEVGARVEKSAFSDAVYFLAVGNREGMTGDTDFARLLALSAGDFLQDGQSTVLPASYYRYWCGTDAAPNAADPARAKELLQTLMERYQQTVMPKIVMLVPDEPEMRQMSDALVTQLQKNTGLFVTREYVSSASMPRRVRNGDFDLALFRGAAYATTAEHYYSAVARQVQYLGAAELLPNDVVGEAAYIRQCEKIFSAAGKLVAIGAHQTFYYQDARAGNVRRDPATGCLRISAE